MASATYDKEITALLVIDPYNDFISEGGKVWARLKTVAEANDCVPHMLQVLNAARKAEFRIFYALHHRYRPGDYATWKYIAPIQKAAWERKTPFKRGRGVARSAVSSNRNRARPWPSSIGVPAALPTRIWICSLKSKASTSSSSSGSSHTRAWRQLFALPLSLVTRSPW
jgi:hypothetical protein